MELVILRDGAELTLTVQGTTHFPQEDLLPYELLEGNIGLINPAAIADPDTLHQAMAAVRDTDGLVVDLRQYPGDPASFLWHPLLLFACHTPAMHHHVRPRT